MPPDDVEATIDRMARECVGNQLRLLGRVVTGLYERELRPLKLTPSQMVILALTAREGQVRSVELSRALQMDASTVSRNVERMRARGWLAPVPGQDERSRPFRLTAAGRKLLRDATSAWEKAQAQAIDFVGRDGVALLRRMSQDLTAEVPPN